MNEHHDRGCMCSTCVVARAAAKLLGTVVLAGVTEFNSDRQENLLVIELRDRTVKAALLELRFFSGDVALHAEIEYSEVGKLVEILKYWLQDLDRRKAMADRRAPLEGAGGGRRTLPPKKGGTE